MSYNSIGDKNERNGGIKMREAKEDYLLEWQLNKDTITISKSFFEHLLNCLANQKFIGELPPNLDALELGKSEYNNIQIENQKEIDRAYCKGRFILSLEYQMTKVYAEMVEKYCEIWNLHIPIIMDYISHDIKNDENAQFKWNYLIEQEIKMWMRICVFQNCVVDYKNEKYTHGIVAVEEFEEICSRRGFNVKMINFLVDILKFIGIGDLLVKKETI